MAATANQAMWGFRFWLKRNPYKSIEAMNSDDFDNMFNAFMAVNVTALATGTTTDPLTYGTLDYPKYAAATRYATDGAGVAAGTTLATNIAACAQSLYPEQGI